MLVCFNVGKTENSLDWKLKIEKDVNNFIHIWLTQSTALVSLASKCRVRFGEFSGFLHMNTLHSRVNFRLRSNTYIIYSWKATCWNFNYSLGEVLLLFCEKEARWKCCKNYIPCSSTLYGKCLCSYGIVISPANKRWKTDDKRKHP